MTKPTDTIPTDKLAQLRRFHGGVVITIERDNQEPCTTLIDADGFEWGRALSGDICRVANHGRRSMTTMLAGMKPGDAIRAYGKTYRIPV